MKELGVSIIRTITPSIVGLFISWLAVVGIIDTTGEISAALLRALDLVCIGAYYALVRLLETKYSSKFGWLLGSPKAPEYKG